MKMPKQQSTSFWSQGILGVNLKSNFQIKFLNPLTDALEVNVSYDTFEDVSELTLFTTHLGLEHASLNLL
jgi:hypothetical protein